MVAHHISLYLRMILQVNSNGVLSFNNSFTFPSAQPLPIPNDILIAPFWADINVELSGQIFYRYSNDTVLLSQVGANISSAFVTNFNPALLFIATWDRVAEFGSNATLVS